jgi:hypothetical protein
MARMASMYALQSAPRDGSARGNTPAPCSCVGPSHLAYRHKCDLQARNNRSTQFHAICAPSAGRALHRERSFEPRAIVGIPPPSSRTRRLRTIFCAGALEDLFGSPQFADVGSSTAISRKREHCKNTEIGLRLSITARAEHLARAQMALPRSPHPVSKPMSGEVGWA